MSEEANHTAKTQRLKRPTIATYLTVIEAIERRIDDEALKRTNLETRVRSAVPNLPPPPERV
jgi:hypothetical protein